MSTITTNDPSSLDSGTSSTGVTVAVVLVIAFIIVIASVAILVVIVVLVTKKKRYAYPVIGERSTGISTSENLVVFVGSFFVHVSQHTGPHSSEGSEGINTTDVTVTAVEDAHCQFIDLKINDAYGTKGD